MLHPQIILKQLEVLLDHYQRKIAEYMPENFVKTGTGEEWSMGQLYTHLLDSSQFFRYQVRCCLQQEKGQEGGDKTAAGENIYQYESFPPIKIKIPEAWRGADPIAQAQEAYPPRLEEERHKLTLLLAPLQTDAGVYKTFHQVCGWLNGLEWFKMAEMHWRHHLRQQQEIEKTLGL